MGVVVTPRCVGDSSLLRPSILRPLVIFLWALTVNLSNLKQLMLVREKGLT